MFGTFGTFEFGAPWYLPLEPPLVGGSIALLGDNSNHGGTIITSNQDGKFIVAGAEVAVNGALHSCPIPGHGVTGITAKVTKSYCNGKLILTAGAVSGCGAVLEPPDRGIYVE